MYDFLLEQDALDEYNRLKDLKKVDVIIKSGYLNISSLLITHRPPTVSTGFRLSDEEAQV